MRVKLCLSHNLLCWLTLGLLQTYILDIRLTTPLLDANKRTLIAHFQGRISVHLSRATAPPTIGDQRTLSILTGAKSISRLG